MYLSCTHTFSLFWRDHQYQDYLLLKSNSQIVHNWAINVPKATYKGFAAWLQCVCCVKVKWKCTDNGLTDHRLSDLHALGSESGPTKKTLFAERKHHYDAHSNQLPRFRSFPGLSRKQPKLFPWFSITHGRTATPNQPVNFKRRMTHDHWMPYLSAHPWLRAVVLSLFFLSAVVSVESSVHKGFSATLNLLQAWHQSTRRFFNGYPGTLWWRERKMVIIITLSWRFLAFVHLHPLRHDNQGSTMEQCEVPFQGFWFYHVSVKFYHLQAPTFSTPECFFFNYPMSCPPSSDSLSLGRAVYLFTVTHPFFPSYMFWSRLTQTQTKPGSAIQGYVYHIVLVFLANVSQSFSCNQDISVHFLRESSKHYWLEAG